jgi:hypothetical protein
VLDLSGPPVQDVPVHRRGERRTPLRRGGPQSDVGGVGQGVTGRAGHGGGLGEDRVGEPLAAAHRRHVTDGALREAGDGGGRGDEDPLVPRRREDAVGDLDSPPTS